MKEKFLNYCSKEKLVSKGSVHKLGAVSYQEISWGLFLIMVEVFFSNFYYMITFSQQ